jgi:competence protein ComEC
LLIAIAAGAVAALTRRRSAVIAAAALGVAAASVSAAWHVHRLRVGPVPALAGQRAGVDVIARLVRDPVLARSGSGLTVIDATVTEVNRHPADSPVLILGYGAGWHGLLPGQRVAVSGRLVPTHRGDDVAAILQARSPPAPIGTPPWWQRLAGRARVRLSAACVGLPPDARGLLPSLVDGDTSAVPSDLQTDMRVTGLTHLEAVSGENVTIVLAVTLALARGAGIRRRGRALVCAATLIAFVVVARPSPSVLRAGVMGGIALLAMVSGRRSSALPALSAAVALLLVIDPFLARTVGFALSVVATAALVTIAPRWTARLERQMPRPLAIAIAVPAAAQLACTPILLLVFGQLTPYAVLANLLAAPAVVPATILGVMTAVTATAWPAGAALIAWLSAVPATMIAEVARTLADLPWAAAGWQATGVAAVRRRIVVAS